MKYDVICVGAGITGCTVARILAEDGKKVLVIDKRDHIGGNAYSKIDAATGIEVHQYGAHLFHTNNQKVWEFVNKFSGWTNYQHRVWTTHNNEVFPMPINLGTINQFFRAAYTPDEARKLIEEQAGVTKGQETQNLVEQGVALIGQPLFDAFIKNYTAKQWQVPAQELSPSIINRLPVRYNYNNRYFSNTYEGLPVDGYAKLFENILAHENIEVQLGATWNDIKVDPAIFLRNPQDDGEAEITIQSGEGENVVRDDGSEKKRDKWLPENSANIVQQVIYTGPIDEYFDFRFGEMKWRSLDLVEEVIDVEDFQGCAVMNYADLEQPYTRIHEFKHFHPERWGKPGYEGYTVNKTVIVREYSKTWTVGEEPYYPVRTVEDLDKLAKYQELANEEQNVIFAGRLGKYQYFDMDQVFAEAIELAKTLKSTLK